MRSQRFLGLTVLFLFGQTATAQTANQLILRADSAYDRHQFGESARLYEAAIRAGVKRTVILYNASRSFALAGNKEKALRYLEQAVDGGWRNVERMRQDSDFVQLRSDPRWAATLRRAQTAKENYDHLHALINQLNHLSSTAYQYRIRSKFDGGGEGSYVGYVIPPTLTSTAEGTFTANVLTANTIELTVTSTLSRGTISAKLDVSGKLGIGGWIYTGELKKLAGK